MRIPVFRFLAALVVFNWVAIGCAFRGIPSHGGGKRFYEEQVCLSTATKKALEDIQWTPVKGKKINLYVMAMGDAGGGAMSGGGFSTSGGLFGSLGSMFSKSGRNNVQTSEGSAQSSAQYSSRASYASYAFANAEDIEYLKGIVMENILKAGGSIAEAEEKPDTELYVMVDNFGTNKWRWDIVFYATENLSAQVRLHAFTIDKKTGLFTSMGKGEKRLTYWENYVLNIGPINNGQIRYDLITPEP